MKNVLPLTLALLATPAIAEPIPPAVEAMIDAASSPEERAVVAGIAKKTNPASAAEIDAKLSAINAAAAKAREEKLASQRFLEGWSGQWLHLHRQHQKPRRGHRRGPDQGKPRLEAQCARYRGLSGGQWRGVARTLFRRL